MNKHQSLVEVECTQSGTVDPMSEQPSIGFVVGAVGVRADNSGLRGLGSTAYNNGFITNLGFPRVPYAGLPNHIIGYKGRGALYGARCRMPCSGETVELEEA